MKELTKFIENTKDLAEWAKAEKLCSKSDPSCWTNFIVTFKLWPDLYIFLVNKGKGW